VPSTRSCIRSSQHAQHQPIRRRSQNQYPLGAGNAGRTRAPPHEDSGANHPQKASARSALPGPPPVTAGAQYAEVVILPDQVYPLPHPTMPMPMPRRQSMPTPLRRSSSQGRLLEGKKGRDKEREDERGRVVASSTKQNIVESLLPSLPRRTANARRMRASEAHHASQRHPHPPVPPAPQLTVSSRWYQRTGAVLVSRDHECVPPEGVQYYGLPFFRLSLMTFIMCSRRLDTRRGTVICHCSWTRARTACLLARDNVPAS
jgi:hypothetical protein